MFSFIMVGLNLSGKSIKTKNHTQLLTEFSNPSFKTSAWNMQFVASNKPDFLGIDFYAPLVNHDGKQGITSSIENQQLF